MRLISHRGNLNGPNPERENHPDYIQDALWQRYDVEVDVWGIEGEYQMELWLGHDEPLYRVRDYWDWDYLGNSRIWYHCKNLEALIVCDEQGHGGTNFFWHQEDDFTITSGGHFWTYPGKQLLSNKSICVLPENSDQEIPKHIYGICSDYIKNYL